MRSLRTSCGVVLAFLAIVATGSVLFAQTGQNFGELVGKVIDEEGAVLPGVMVTLSGPAMMGTQTAVTNERGAYRFPAVTSGTYPPTFGLPVFAKLGRENTTLPARQTVTVDAQMKVAALQETVTVTGASPVVDVANAKVGARLDQSLLQNLLTIRSIFGSVTLLSGR